MRLDKDSEKKNDIEHNTNTYNARHTIHNKLEQEWLKENKEAIEKQNERMEKEGVFSDEYRRF